MSSTNNTVLSNVLGKTFHFEKRGGPHISFSGTPDSAITYNSRALLDNDPNIKRGQLAFTPAAQESNSGSFAASGPAMSTMMAALPGYKTPVGAFPLGVKVLGSGNKIQVTSAPTADGDQKQPVTLTAFPPVPEILGEHIAKTNMGTAEGPMAQQLAWVTSKDGELSTGKSATFDCRPQKSDFETGSGTKFEWRDEDKNEGNKFSELVFGSAAPSGWNSGEANSDASTLTFHSGSHAATFQYSYEQVKISPGWGPTELEIVKLEGDGKAIRLMHKGMSKPVVEQWK